MVRRVIFYGIILALIGCVSAPVKELKPEIPGKSAITRRLADSLWAARADTAAAHSALRAYRTLAADDPNSIETWSRLSRAYYYTGQYLTLDPVKRDSLFMRGYEASQSILTRNQNYHALLYSTGDENLAIRGLDKSYINALYWGMANYGQWLATKGDLVRLGQREVIWTTLEHVHDLDSTYYYGAYYRYKGALLSRDPQLNHDTASIRDAFDQARTIAPRYLGNNTLMAAYYCRLTGDRDLFYRLLTTVVTAKLDPALPYYPENLREKQIADRLMIKAEKENWFKK